MSLQHSINNHDIILVQETMGSSADLSTFLVKTLKGWSFIGLDVTGNSGGLITSWTNSILVLNCLVVTSCLLLEFYSKD